MNGWDVYLCIFVWLFVWLSSVHLAGCIELIGCNLFIICDGREGEVKDGFLMG